MQDAWGAAECSVASSRVIHGVTGMGKRRRCCLVWERAGGGRAPEVGALGHTFFGVGPMEHTSAPFWGKGRDPLPFQMKSFNFPPLSIELGIDSPHPPACDQCWSRSLATLDQQTRRAPVPPPELFWGRGNPIPILGLHQWGKKSNILNTKRNYGVNGSGCPPMLSGCSSFAPHG